MHLTFEDLHRPNWSDTFKINVDLDEAFFYSVPTSFFVIDSRIPKEIRELITEAEGCKKMNYLTGASACTRKAIYKLLLLHEAEGENYDDKIAALQNLFPNIDEVHFEILGHIKDMTSDHVHEQSWEAWSSQHLTLFLEALKAMLHEIYVVPDEKAKRAKAVRALRGDFGKAKAEQQAMDEAPQASSTHPEGDDPDQV